MNKKMNKADFYNEEEWDANEMCKGEDWKPRYHRLLTGHEKSDDMFADFAMEVDKMMQINLDEYLVESESIEYGNYVVTMVSEDRRHCVVGICNDYQKKNSCFEIIAC
jgi:hypothetical protein